MIYLDSSALLKLLFQEPESDALEQWLSSRAASSVVSSEIARIEVIRATRRIAADVLPAARSLVGQLDLIPLTGALIGDAADAGLPLLRSLDAIHLASALSVRADLSAFVGYDHRLNEAAEAAGLQPTMPKSQRSGGAVVDRGAR